MRKTQPLSQASVSKEKGVADSLDLVFHQGEKNKPACIFIHGMGMNKDIWINPSYLKIMAGMFPLRIMLRKQVFPPKSVLRTLYHDLKDMGCTVLAWSQSRPAGSIDIAVKELRAVVDFTNGLEVSGIILIGHSRGGLVARKLLEESSGAYPIKALITLCTPHQGTSMAKWAVYASKAAPLIKPLMPETQKGSLTKAIKRVLDFLESRAVRELLPNSDFLRSFKNIKPKGICFISAGGTNPELISINNIFSIPSSLERLMPKRLPEEMKEGKGDGMVSLGSSRLPSGDEHLSFHFNHAEMVVAPLVREELIKKITGLK